MSEPDTTAAAELPPTLALVAMMSKNVHRAAADHQGRTTDLRQVIALSYLRELGSVGQRYLGPVLCLDANNTVLLLNQLEVDGLIRRIRDPEDRRRHLIELTETGHAVLRETESAMGELEDELLGALDPVQRAAFRELLHLALYGDGGLLARAGAGAGAGAAA